MFCPICGQKLVEENGEFRCEIGDMWLSPKMAREFVECFVEKSRQPSDAPYPVMLGGIWFCPGCGIPMQVKDRCVCCSVCDRALTEFIYALIEKHPHLPHPG